MTILKDAQYWKDYNQKRREYLLLKKRESRLKASQSRSKLKGLVVNTSNISVVDNLVVDQVVDIQTYNEQVYQRAGTREETRFYTFNDGKKIVRTKCGCNPNNQGFYDWCLDNCQYFTWWRNKQISNERSTLNFGKFNDK